MRADDVGGDAPPSLHGNLDLAVLVLDVAWRDVEEPVFADGLPMVRGGVAGARVRDVAFDDRAVEMPDEILDERRLQVGRVVPFAGTEFDGDLAFICVTSVF